MILFFDTETTGLTPGKIIQLSYILYADGKVKGKNFFFSVDYIPIESTLIHGFTAEKIRQLSNGLVFGDYADEIYEDFSSAEMIVAHNVAFDVKFLIEEFLSCGSHFKYKESFD